MNKELTFQKTTKQQYINAYSTWFDSFSESHIPFTTTVVFRSSGYKQMPDFWRSEYKHKFLWKINKQLSRHASELVFYSDFCRYEFGESSRYKSLSDQRKPHHVHGIILIPKKYVHKILDKETNKISDRLIKDFNSIKNVSSVLIERIIEGKSQDWISYMTKRKDFHQDQ